MKTIQAVLSEKLHEAVYKAYPQLSGLDHKLSLEVAQSVQPTFGDYQFNDAMRMNKLLGIAPRIIAEAIVKEVDRYISGRELMIEQLEIAGPGFINITLSPHFLSKRLTTLIHDPRLGISPVEQPQRVIIDFSSPNVAKEMHVGHLRSTIIGDCLARLFEFLGHDVVRLNHVGDWGTAFGMLIAYIKLYAPGVLTGEQPTDLTHLVQWYRAAKQIFDTDLDFKKSAHQEVVALQRGNPEALQAWRIICEISQKAYEEIYQMLDVWLTVRGESFYNPYLELVVQEFERKGLITISDGAKCVFLEGFYGREGEPLPLIIQKSDGGYNYATTDLAAIRHRILEEKADRIIYVTDAGQSLHFQMIFKAAEKVGYLNPAQVRVDHVAFGLVLGPDGKKLRTRSGDTERLMDLLTAAVDHARAVLLERNPALSTQETDHLAQVIGIGAVKYADLSSHRVKDYVFSYERMLRFDGNTAVFLLYSYVRAEAIKRKVGVDVATLYKEITLEHESEIALGLHILQFGEVLEQVTQDLLPNRLAEYLYGLAEKFNAFFRDCRVEGSPQQNSRLLLCDIFARTMRQGLAILGIETVERM